MRSKRSASAVRPAASLGYIEGRNIVLEYRWAEGKLDRLTDLATELVGSKVDMITTLSTPAVLAARNATTTIPSD